MEDTIYYQLYWSIDFLQEVMKSKLSKSIFYQTIIF